MFEAISKGFLHANLKKPASVADIEDRLTVYNFDLQYGSGSILGSARTLDHICNLFRRKFQ